MYKGDFSVCWIVPFVMATFAYLFPPYSDFARNLDLVYELKDMGIENINPYQRPFCDIKSAFMFFQHNKKKDRYSQRLLLLNRKELYLVRDYRHLLTIAL